MFSINLNFHMYFFTCILLCMIHPLNQFHYLFTFLFISAHRLHYRTVAGEAISGEPHPLSSPEPGTGKAHVSVTGIPSKDQLRINQPGRQGQAPGQKYVQELELLSPDPRGPGTVFYLVVLWYECISDFLHCHVWDELFLCQRTLGHRGKVTHVLQGLFNVLSGNSCYHWMWYRVPTLAQTWYSHTSTRDSSLPSLLVHLREELIQVRHVFIMLGFYTGLLGWDMVFTSPHHHPTLWFRLTLPVPSLAIQQWAWSDRSAVLSPRGLSIPRYCSRLVSCAVGRRLGISSSKMCPCSLTKL